MAVKQYIVIFLSGILVGAVIIKKYSPTIAETTKTVTQTEIKDHTIIKEIRKKDGTIEKTTITDSNTKTDQSKVSQKDTIIVTKKYKIEALYGINTSSKSTTYGILGSSKIIGDLSVGAFYLNNNTLGVTIGLDF